MIKRIKFAFQIVRYSHGLIGGLFGMACFLAVGFLPRLTPVGNLMLPNLFLMLVAIWPAQLIYSLSASGMVQASPQKKALQTSVPALLTVIVAVPMYLLSVVLSLGYRNDAIVRGGLLLGALGAFFLMLYIGTAYKFFVISTIIFMAWYGLLGNLQYRLLTKDAVRQLLEATPFWAVVLLGLLLIVAGTCVAYALSLLLYRYPLSKYAQTQGLRKWM